MRYPLGHLVIFAFLAMVFVGCADKMNNDNLIRVKNGMSQAEVKAILGKPDRVESGEILGLSGTTFYYEKENAHVQISFINDHVTTKLGSFGK